MKYIIIHPNEGIFLGTAKHHELDIPMRDPTDTRLVALFSTNNVFDITKAVGFSTEKDANDYMRIHIHKSFPESFVVGVKDNDLKTPYVDVIDIVKAGYGQYAWDMIDALPMPSQMDH